MVSITSSSSGVTGERYTALWDTRNIYTGTLQWQLFTPNIFLSHHTCKLEFFKVELLHIIYNNQYISLLNFKSSLMSSMFPSVQWPLS